MPGLSAGICAGILFILPAHLHAAGVLGMTLRELSGEYEYAAELLRGRLHDLRLRLKSAQDREEIFWLKQRMAELSRMLQQMNELAELTAHYYERGYWRDEKYRI